MAPAAALSLVSTARKRVPRAHSYPGCAGRAGSRTFRRPCCCTNMRIISLSRPPVLRCRAGWVRALQSSSHRQNCWATDRCRSDALPITAPANCTMPIRWPSASCSIPNSMRRTADGGMIISTAEAGHWCIISGSRTNRRASSMPIGKRWRTEHHPSRQAKRCLAISKSSTRTSTPICGSARSRRDQADLLIMADHPLRDAARLRGRADIHSFTRLRRSALATTLTDDSAIAAAAIIGESRMPKTG